MQYVNEYLYPHTFNHHVYAHTGVDTINNKGDSMNNTALGNTIYNIVISFPKTFNPKTAWDWRAKLAKLKANGKVTLKHNTTKCQGVITSIFIHKWTQKQLAKHLNLLQEQGGVLSVKLLDQSLYH